MTIMKSEFAKRCNVSKGRVSQWLAAKQIDGTAIVGTGRKAKLDPVVALAQLKLRLSTDERFGLNGLWTNLDWLPEGDEDEADDLSDVERHRGVMVDLADVERMVDDTWVLSDYAIQGALKAHPEALAAYMGIRPRLVQIRDGRG
jgi:transposase